LLGAEFRDGTCMRARPTTGVAIDFNHRNNSHMAIGPENVRAELATDFG
jgi:hypothetical protein